MNDVNGTPRLPPSLAEKEAWVRRMFGEIAPTYDLLNSLLSANLHKQWRPAAVRWARFGPGDWVLDVATGTGDLAVALARTVGPSGGVVGVDFCEPMLARGKEKARHQAGCMMFLSGQAEALPFSDHTFDGATMGFALRNVTDVAGVLREMARVVRPGGRVMNLELTQPHHPWLRRLYDFYSWGFLPLIGGAISGRRRAYTYLPHSIRNFLSVEQVREVMHQVGLDPVEIHPLAGGIATIHVGVKRRGK